MTVPIIIRRPRLIAQKLMPDGTPSIDPPVDLSCDVSAVEITPDVSIDRVQTFCGNYPVTGDNEVSATISVVVGPDTETNWSTLVGESIELQVYDRDDSIKYRRFVTELPFDPSLYGPTDAEEQVRAFDFDVPVFDGPEWATA
jgi:hypothetical protein